MSEDQWSDPLYISFGSFLAVGHVDCYEAEARYYDLSVESAIQSWAGLHEIVMVIGAIAFVGFIVVESSNKGAGAPFLKVWKEVYRNSFSVTLEKNRPSFAKYMAPPLWMLEDPFQDWNDTQKLTYYLV